MAYKIVLKKSYQRFFSVYICSPSVKLYFYIYNFDFDLITLSQSNHSFVRLKWC